MADKSEGNAPGVEQGAGQGGDDIAGIMAFDPFAPPKVEAGAEGDTKPEGGDKTSDATQTADKKGAAATGKESPTPKPGAAPVAQPAAPVPAKPEAQAPDFGKLFREQTEAIKSLVAAPTPGKADATPEPPKFNLGIPPQIMDAMASEDPQERATATHALVNGIANVVWKETMAQVRAELGTIVQSIPQVIEAHASTRAAQQQVFTDFYGAHQHLNKPEFQPLVLSAAQAVFQDYAQAGKQVTWNAEMRDAIAEKIHLAIPQLRPAAAPGKTNGTQPAAPRFTPGGGARPSGGPTGPEAEMLSVLGIRQQ